MGIIFVPPLVQTCPNCGLRPETWTNDCPRCGRTIASPERMRYYGRGMITMCGMGVVMVTVVMLAMARTFLRGEDLGLLALLASVQAFFIVGIVTGARALRTGRQDMSLVHALFGIAGVILLLVTVYQAFLL
jgi:hypothetical protein